LAAVDKWIRNVSGKSDGTKIIAVTYIHAIRTQGLEAI
jgi:hypothetical protein